MSESNEVMNEELPAHDMETEAGDPSQVDLPFFARLLLEYLQKMDGNGLKLDELKNENYSFGKFNILKLMKIFVSIGLLIFILIFQWPKVMQKKYFAN